MKKHVIRLLALCLSLVLCFTLLLPAQAKEIKIVRVAYYLSNGFFEYNDGKVSGYGPELLDKVAADLNATFYYIKADSAKDAQRLVLNDQVDIMLPARLDNVAGYDAFYLSPVSLLDSYSVILCPDTRDDLIYDDEDTIRTLKIGIEETVYDTDEIYLYLKDLRLPTGHLKVYSTSSDLTRALASGEIDAMITDATQLTKGFKPLLRMGYSGNYLASRPEYAYIREIEHAISLLKTADSNFFSDNTMRYFPQLLRTPLTKTEYDYIKQQNELVFWVVKDMGFYVRRENKKLKGLYPAVAKEISRRLEIPYEVRDVSPRSLTKRIEDKSLGIGKTGIIMELFYDPASTKELNLHTTYPYISFAYCQLYQKGKSLTDSFDKAAVVYGDRAIIHYVEESAPDSEIVWCDSYEECIEKVRNGKADVTYVDTEITEYYMQDFKNTNLAVSFLQISTYACMATKNSRLASILNKMINDMSLDGTLKKLMESEKQNQELHGGILSAIYNNPQQALRIILLVSGLIILILVLLVLLYRFRKQNEFLHTMSAAKTDFMSRMSHDIRTPMNAVIGMTHLARDEENLPPAVDEYLSKIEGAGEYLLGLINDILDMTKLQSGKVVFNYETVDMFELAANLKQLLLPTFQARGVLLECDYTGVKYPYIKTDRMRVMQILSNLLSNAAKFTPPGRHVYWTAKSYLTKNNQIETVTIIRDEGCGMSESFLKKMYDPFEQEDNPYSKGVNGTGLGLPIVKNLVDQMGGVITVESQLDVGTTFTITFTRSMAEAFSTLPQEANHKEPITYENLSVLIVEDQPLNQEILKRLLEKKNMIVYLANNGKEAVEFMKTDISRDICAILMDIRMPEMDGIEATRQIRQLPDSHAQTIPIIALTANAMDSDREATKQAGMNDHLAKPINAKELYETLAHYL